MYQKTYPWTKETDSTTPCNMSAYELYYKRAIQTA